MKKIIQKLILLWFIFFFKNLIVKFRINHIWLIIKKLYYKTTTLKELIIYQKLKYFIHILLIFLYLFYFVIKNLNLNYKQFI